MCNVCSRFCACVNIYPSIKKKVRSRPNEQMEPEDNKLLGPNHDRNVGSTTPHAESPQIGTARHDSSNPHESNLSSPTVSVTSSDSFAPNCSGYSANGKPPDGHNPEEGRSESCIDDLYKQESKSISSVSTLEQLSDQKEKLKHDKNGVVRNMAYSNGSDANDDNGQSKDEIYDKENAPSSVNFVRHNPEEGRPVSCKDDLYKQESTSISSVNALEQSSDKKEILKQDKNGVVPNMEYSYSSDANDDNIRNKDDCYDEENAPSSVNFVGHNPEKSQSESRKDDLYKQKSTPMSSVNTLEQSIGQKENLNQDKNGVACNLETYKSSDADDDNSRSRDDCCDEENAPSSTSDVRDEFWDPPEPENEEDDRDTVKAVATLDDDDDNEDDDDNDDDNGVDDQENSMAVATLDDDKDGCTDGNDTDLGKPSSLISSKEGVSNSMAVATLDDDKDECTTGNDRDLGKPNSRSSSKEGVSNSMAVATLADDRDGCTNAKDTDWGKPSSMSTSKEGVSSSHRLEGERKKAMEEVMNGKFKNLVSQLLKKFGIENSNNKKESWVEIVTQLAWQAASFVNPDATEDKAMDPAGYVQVKCISTGSRSDSKLVEGLVFKKHAAHKSMATKFENPRLLLIQGMLGPSSVSSGLASFASMIDSSKVNEHVDDLIKNLQACRPDVILVEKSAYHAVFDRLLALKVTLVVDMKLHRLERIARCTGSPIQSSHTPLNRKLKRCKYLYFEKFEEEHSNVGEGGKKPSKTLMFLEGCPTRLGCTILLKGSPSEELKKIKCVVQCAVVMAYHFILETSFLVDQRAMFSTIAYGGAVQNSKSSSISLHGQLKDDNASAVQVSDVNNKGSSHVQESTETPSSSGVLEISISSTSQEEISSHVQEKPISAELPSINDELTKVSIVSPTTFEQVSSYLSGAPPEALDLAPDPEKAVVGGDVEMKGSLQEGKPKDEDFIKGEVRCSAADKDARKVDDDIEDYMQQKDKISSVLDSESILVLMSSRNASRGTICEQSHLSHIKFYRNFDVPLGKFLRDNLFSQSVLCKACFEPPEAHFYYYAHHNKQLSIQVKRLVDKKLPGESEGKLWMWSRCGKCEPDKEKATKRVLISTAASGLSFGKFLELSFSSQSSFNRLSSCGHSLQKDFLYFFGCGSMVAMFRYSRVATYTVSVPAQKLEFNSSVDGDCLLHEIESVYTKGLLLFTEIGNYLKKLESQLSGADQVLNGSSRAFADIIGMLRLERSEFEGKIKNIRVKNDDSLKSVHILLRLNQLRWEILLEACVWDWRLRLLLSSSSNLPHGTPTNGVVPRQMVLKKDLSDEREAKEGSHTAPEKRVLGQVVLEEPKLGEVGGTAEAVNQAVLQNLDLETSLAEQIVGVNRGMQVGVDGGHHNAIIEGKEFFKKCTDVDVQVETVTAADKLSVKELPCEEMVRGEKQDLMSSPVTEQEIDQGSTTSGDKLPLEIVGSVVSSYSEDPREWVWNPFGKIREECMNDLRKGCMPKFGHVPKFEVLRSPDFSSTVSQMIKEAALRLHIPFSNGEFIVTDYDGEISSSVACALASRENMKPDENDFLQRAATAPPHGLSELYCERVIHSASSLPRQEPLLPHGLLHPEVNLGAEKFPPKGKYSVVILYAEEFLNLRKDCCPSELDYIASLSRCKNWDAKGGKSKSIFSKTLDERLIIKEIKKTEYESFMKFATQYFNYMKESFNSGNQTCLAKILGIYQVTIRNPKSGKETKHDIMVQENLSFGRNITRQYDLKGALHARFTETADGTGDVLLDQNFVNDMNSSPLYVGQKAKRLLQRAVWNDTTFLTSINVMDYSLLVGVDRQHRELVCGIIDYLRQYTWDKQLENWVKTSLVVPKNMLPTIISPREYKKRFRKFMDTHFLTVPDNWCSQRSSNPCKLCGIRSGDSSPVKSEKQEEEPRAHD